MCTIKIWTFKMKKKKTRPNIKINFIFSKFASHRENCKIYTCTIYFWWKMKTCNTNWKINPFQTLIQTIASIHSWVYTGWGRSGHLIDWGVVLGALRYLTTGGVIGVSHEFAGRGNVSIGGASGEDTYHS